jgi:Rap1a immunity proteins
MRAIPIIVCALLLASSTAFAQVGFTSGSALLASCEDPARRPECTQYIAGVLDAHGYDLSRFGSRRDFCIPEDISTEELERVVVKWLKEHPEKLRVTAANLVVLGFVDAFKCKDDRD